MKLWELAAREHIRETVAAYAHFADRGKLDQLVALFTEDGVLQIGEGEVHRGRDAIRAFLAGTRSELRAATERPLIRHHVSNLRITMVSPIEAAGMAYFFVVTERGPDHWGRYRDLYRSEAGRWLFGHGWTVTQPIPGRPGGASARVTRRRHARFLRFNDELRCRSFACCWPTSIDHQCQVASNCASRDA